MLHLANPGGNVEIYVDGVRLARLDGRNGQCRRKARQRPARKDRNPKDHVESRECWHVCKNKRCCCKKTPTTCELGSGPCTLDRRSSDTTPKAFADNGRWHTRCVLVHHSIARMTHEDADATIDDNIASVVSCRSSRAAKAVDKASAVDAISCAKASLGSAK